MTFDIFFSICQTPVDGYKPSEKKMFQNFFEQVRLADQLGFKTAWVAETHLSCQVQKRNPGAVIPHFEGEIGLNTDILQLAHQVFAQTRSIQVGSAIRNILCNGGPMAHAEAIRMFLTLHDLHPQESRKLEIGFAAGRFPFSNAPYGIRPRNEQEATVWPALRGLIFRQATEIFLRFLKGDVFSSAELTPLKVSGVEIPPFWQFDQVGVIPFEAPLKLLNLTIGSHDAEVQELANRYLPCGVFNLSITPDEVIEKTHQHMKKVYNVAGGKWNRSLMPRTALVFIDEDSKKASQKAQAALQNYWNAMEGTIDPVKVQAAVQNALVGTPQQVNDQVKAKFHPEDRLMLWFDFNNHDCQDVMNSMELFKRAVS
jgi:alkanesulfonate monooxygenase SsuD/methylene tetrahydromethanopterin reductase-like flavin-dependent oxidoreductase (luciferase family)